MCSTCVLRWSTKELSRPHTDDAYYELEIVVRLLLRDSVNIQDGTWPVNPRMSNRLTGPWQTLAVDGSLRELSGQSFTRARLRGRLTADSVTKALCVAQHLWARGT